MTWRDGPVVGFDTEATGKQPEADALISAALVRYTPGEGLATQTWLADPGRAIPPAATAVHGITNERARRDGRALPEVLDELVLALAHAMSQGAAIVGANLAYDFTLLEANCRAQGVRTLSDRMGGAVGIRPLIDVWLVASRLRPTLLSHALSMLASSYEAKVDAKLHDAAADATLAMRVAWKMHDQHEEVRTDARTLHARQVRWYLPELTKQIAKARKRGDVIDAEMRWPVKPHIPAQRRPEGYQPRLTAEVIPGDEQAVQALMGAGFTVELLGTTERIS